MRKIELKRNFMNTTITIQVIAPYEVNTIEIQNDIESAFGQFDRIVAQYTRFAPSSELSILNQNNGNWHPVSQEFYDLIETMLKLAELTDGIYDPTIIDLLEAYGYSAKKDYDQRLSDPELENKIEFIVKNRPSFREIELDPQNLQVKLAPGQRIDLGSIGKGYAIDCAFDILSQKYQNILIDAGGDIRCLGLNIEQKPWQLGLKHRSKEEEGYIGRIELQSGTLCSSGSWARQIGKFHHLINTSDGAPENRIKTVFVTGDTAIRADVWSTITFLMGPPALDILPTNLHALLINSDEQAAKSPSFPEILDIAQ